MASKAASKRLTKEYVAMQKEPPPFVWAIPDEKNILHWNFIIRGPPDSPYYNGEYHGLILFPPEYPFRPPGIKMLTPSGRFQPDKKICFSMSDFHPGSWNPAWSVATILTGLLSFMLSDEMTTGSVTSSESEKRAYAARSHAWNILQKRFREAFPEYCEPELKDLPNMAQNERGIRPPPPVSRAPSLLTPSISRSSYSSAVSSIDTPTLTTPSASTSSLAFPPLSNNHGTSPTANQPNHPIPVSNSSHNTPPPPTSPKGWGQLIWDKWQWGLLIAIAVIVSRMSSST